ncbi:hypothetical protein [Pseudomonas syringae]|uniref:hypothetical protein n=1 Tax=Pseudomonas syringae TaxID=317 RepID=UPI0032046A10
MNSNAFNIRPNTEEKFVLTEDSKSTSAYKNDTTLPLESIIREYNSSGEDQTLSFRSLVSWIKVGERATHYIHPYPAKLLPQIAHFFLAARGYFGSGIKVLDPFGGTGTVALETLLSGNEAYYADANPLARIIAKVKTTKVDPNELSAQLEVIITSYKRSRSKIAPDVVNLEKWFNPDVIRGLVRLKSSIEKIQNTDVREFFLVVFSATVRRSSNADPRLSVPVQRKPSDIRKNVSAVEIFSQQAELSIQRMKALLSLSSEEFKSYNVGFDARNLKKPAPWNSESQTQLPDETIDLIITSPPYAGAQKYVRASSLSLGWLGMAGSSDLKGLENKSIGREHLPKSVWNTNFISTVGDANDLIVRVRQKNPLRAAIIATYLNEMESCIAEMSRVLVENGHLILIIGNNEVCGEVFSSSEYLASIANNHKLVTVFKAVDEIKSRGLMTKRNKTAGLISREWVILFKKVSDRDVK